ncbi:hypothetical protein [Sinomicrobium oceani]|uniref:hypothetical protein n=1 Tax=Sinomicrobium oceani TaxID=1150368 RepID=UPI00227AA212|nr:hypothetical protein [Sinomicrobium oceani]
METLQHLWEADSDTLKVVMGVALRLLIGARRFYRRGWGGLQHFRHYLPALVTLFVEGMLYLVANGLILWGLVGMIF